MDEAVGEAAPAQKYDPVTRRVAAVPLQLVVRDFKLSAYIDVRAPARFVRAVVGDNGEGVSPLTWTSSAQ